MTQNIETLSFFERFQTPMTRRAVIMTCCTALGAAVLTVIPSFLKAAVPQLNHARPAEEVKQNLKPASKSKTTVTRHPGPRW